MGKGIGTILPAILSALLVILVSVSAEADQASLILDLKKARATFETARDNYENDKKLYENQAISENQYNQSRNQLLSTEVDFQKLILNVMAQQSYIIVEKALKYQGPGGKRHVKVALRSMMEGNQEYLEQFEEHFDIFSPEMRSGKVYNVFVSLVHLGDNTIIGSPYEVRVPTIELGEIAEVDFELLQDVESLQVSLNYSGQTDQKNIYLEKDASANVVDINSTQFSQEANLGSDATFDLTLERFSTTDDVYRLVALNLPRQISSEFTDPSGSVRLSQIKFTQGVNTKNLALKTYLPDRDDKDVVLDFPLIFYAVVLSRAEYEKLGDIRNRRFTAEELSAIEGGKVRLELIPKGVGELEVIAETLYYEIKPDEGVEMPVTVKNIGTRRLDNIRITADDPMNWTSTVEPGVLSSLEVEKEAVVVLTFTPPANVGVGAHEVKIKTEALADTVLVEAEDKNVRIQITAKAPLLGTLFLVLALIGMVLGIVIFGIRLSRR